MSWATAYIEELKKGKMVEFRPMGRSMVPLIESGQLVKVEPVTKVIEKKDIVLCSVNGKQYLHLVITSWDDPVAEFKTKDPKEAVYWLNQMAGRYGELSSN